MSGSSQRLGIAATWGSEQTHALFGETETVWRRAVAERGALVMKEFKKERKLVGGWEEGLWRVRKRSGAELVSCFTACEIDGRAKIEGWEE